MALPKLETPTYELELPSTGEKIKYRPFLVKEQKVLMMAQGSKNDKEISNAIGSLVSSCTFDKVNPEKSPMFDIEHIKRMINEKKLTSDVMPEEKVQEKRLEMERAAAQRLQPHHIEGFFLPTSLFNHCILIRLCLRCCPN